MGYVSCSNNFYLNLHTHGFNSGFFFTKGWGSWSPHNHNKSIHLQTYVATIEVRAAYTLQTCNYTIEIHVQYYTHTLYAVLKMWKKGGRIHVFSGLEQYLFCHAFSWFYIYLERKQLPPPPPPQNKYLYWQVHVYNW